MRQYNIGKHIFGVVHPLLEDAVKAIQGFAPFRATTDKEEFTFFYAEDTDHPVMAKCVYEFDVDGVKAFFGNATDGSYLLYMSHKNGEELSLSCPLSVIGAAIKDERVVCLYGALNIQMLRFALWIGYGLMTLSYDTIAIHSSCIVCHDKAVLFLGESGTGKSTHTRLWREHIDGATLLNDDSPILRVESGEVYVYGSAWSGKTPCYKAEKYPLAGIVRLSQAPYNEIKKLSVLKSYAALHPSCPPEFAYSEPLYDAISNTISKVLDIIPVYHLSCLPNKEAAILSHQTIFSRKNL